MKVYKRKRTCNSKDSKIKRKTISNSPCLKYSFTEFPHENSNIKVNTLTKNKTSKHIQQITKKNIVNMLSLSNNSNLKRQNLKPNSKINSESLYHENSTNSLLKKSKIKSKNKSRMKPQKIIVTMTNDFSFSNSNNCIDDNNKRNQLKNIFNYKHFRTNTFSNIHSNKNIINLKNNNFLNQIKYYNIHSPKSTKRTFESLTFKFNELNEELNNKLNENKDNRNKRYNSIQKIFEDLIMILPEENKAFFKKILIGIHDIVNEYYLELKELKKEFELNKKKLISLENDNIYNLKIIKQKDLEIEKLKKKISNTLSIQEQQIISKSTNSSFVGSLSTDKEKSLEEKKKNFKSKTQNKIEEFNKKNIFDLNALYFYDKVNMKSEFKSVPKNNNGDLIPPLDLDFEKHERLKEEKRNEELMKKIKENKLSFIEKVALSFDLN